MTIRSPVGAPRSRTISELYATFEAAVAKTKAMPELPDGELSDPAFDRAVDRCGKIAWRIVKAPARSVDEMLTKIAVAGWCIGVRHNDLAELAAWQPGRLHSDQEECYALVTLREDVKRLMPRRAAR